MLVSKHALCVMLCGYGRTNSRISKFCDIHASMCVRAYMFLHFPRVLHTYSLHIRMGLQCELQDQAALKIQTFARSAMTRRRTHRGKAVRSQGGSHTASSTAIMSAQTIGAAACVTTGASEACIVQAASPCTQVQGVPGEAHTPVKTASNTLAPHDDARVHAEAHEHLQASTTPRHALPAASSPSPKNSPNKENHTRGGSPRHTRGDEPVDPGLHIAASPLAPLRSTSPSKEPRMHSPNKEPRSASPNSKEPRLCSPTKEPRKLKMRPTRGESGDAPESQKIIK